jgi:hypothetical protein
MDNILTLNNFLIIGGLLGLFILSGINKKGWNNGSAFLGLIMGISICTYETWIPIWCYTIPILLIIILYYMLRD